MVRVLIFVLPLLLALYALIDCIQTDESEVRGLPKIAWIILIVLVGILGPVAWLIAGRQRRSGTRLPGLPGLGERRGGPAPRPLAPDDDPEFLGRLGSTSRDRMLEQWEQEMNRPSGGGEPDGDEGGAPSSGAGDDGDRPPGR